MTKDILVSKTERERRSLFEFARQVKKTISKIDKAVGPLGVRLDPLE